MTGISGLKAPRALHSSTPEELSAFARADALGAPMSLLEHRKRLADSGRSAEIDAQAASRHAPPRSQPVPSRILHATWSAGDL